ncbi:MAG: choline ABC transporter ATP-binding protein [Steroidobacteraceae bacterium]
MSAALQFRHVDILFPAARGGRGRREAMRRALELLDGGAPRMQIAERTGIVVGVADASLSVEPAEISVLMGLSGSGKSTLLRAANGLNTVTRGQVLVGGAAGDVVDVAACDRARLRQVRRQRIAMVFQQFGLLPWRTVRENVGLGLELRGTSPAERQRIVDEKLALVGLREWADRYASELSGGMQQRVGLARAFATEADILLMDEPFSALDPLIRTKLQDELLLLQRQVRKTILFVSHDLDEALKLGNRISILEGGRIVQTGAPRDIVLRPVNDYVAEFVRHMNPLNVLTGGMVMRRCEELRHEGKLLWLDVARRYQLTLDSRGACSAVRIDGIDAVVTQQEGFDAAAAGPNGVVVIASESTPLHRLIQLRQASGHPVLLAEDGIISGVCCENEIVRALAGKPARPS